MICSDRRLREIGPDIIQPFQPEQVRVSEDDLGNPYKIVSYGTSSYGYDIRLSGAEFKVFSPIGAREIDPKHFNERCLIPAEMNVDITTRAWYWVIPPHSYALGVTLERFSMPSNVLGICVGKSTYARCGLVVNTTPLEPGWEGNLVLEFANNANLPIRLYVNEGIAQVIFFESNEPCLTSYADRSGKYQHQVGITSARV